MADHPTPEEIRRATFRVVFRGFEQDEVTSHLERLAVTVEDLTAERDRLRERLGEFADRDLREEFEAVGREVTAVLEAARAAAESMRERASGDAARWRSEAMAEVQAMTRDARADAESMRSDAWATGTQLLDQVQAEIERQRADTERTSLAIRGEAEREAHRLTSAARRESDDVLRAAKMEAERMVGQARVEHDDIIADAHRQAETAQQRARALEERRRELMDELESVRAALTSVEDELEERRQGVGLTEPPELPTRMVIAGEEGTEVKDWEEGRTVRVIRPGPSHEDDAGAAPTEGDDRGDDVANGDRLAEEVARLRRREEPAPADREAEEMGPGPPTEAAPPEEAAAPPISEEEGAGEPDNGLGTPPEEGEVPAAPPEEGRHVEEVEPAAGPEEEQDDLSDLFRRLRRPPEREVEAESTPPEADRIPASAPEEEAPVSPLPEGVDPFETRERLLLPITNAALRSVKRGLADAQNQALESLRVHEGRWSPDQLELGTTFREELDTLVDQASQAGVEAAIEMGMAGLGSLSPEPPPPQDLGGDLVGALTGALESAGGSRERQVAVSRVFRGWRTDEAERRVRTAALVSYHAALRQALESRERAWQWVAAGRLCPTCRVAAENLETVPPAHRDCQCTIVPA